MIKQIVVAVALVTGCLSIYTGDALAGGNQCGSASWYGPGFNGKMAASGERFNQNAMTAAHKTLPFGTKVRVTNRHTGRSVIVRINDRGPFVKGRVIDLSPAAAKAIGVGGIAQVSLSTN